MADDRAQLEQSAKTIAQLREQIKKQPTGDQADDEEKEKAIATLKQVIVKNEECIQEQSQKIAQLQEQIQQEREAVDISDISDCIER